MSFVCDIPPTECLVRKEYLYNLESHHGEYENGLLIAADSVEGRSVGFDVLLDNGALFSRLPISAFSWKECDPLPLSVLSLWNCFSNSVEAHQYRELKGTQCAVKGLGPGTYLYTLSWLDGGIAELAGDYGFKRGHVIRLDTGHFAIQPNNRLQWHSRAWVTKPFPEKPDYKTNSHEWNSETDKGFLPDTDDYFY